ncbi:serpin B6-like [Vombatus ursinus]|uniref:Serpin B8 n=1 Tax=Vombatus ursinus TaxID=29139 RepID=A0A4X2LMZ1_VOMUR|nr:serpin B6-like [Vombatus ursinus]XP_027732655.1 serpin B6-like [Vombatus ursinus]
MDSLSEVNGPFAINLLKKLSEKDNSQNVVFSPLSISSALGMLFLGAKGGTAAQIVKVLFANRGGDIHKDLQALFTEVNKCSTHYSLRIANKLFGEKTYDFLSTFKEACQNFYSVELGELSFAKAPEESRKHINAWIAEKTEGKIAEMLPTSSVGPLTRLVLVDGIYFKGKWNEQFKENYTREMFFKTRKNEKKTVQMMFKEATFKMTYIKEVSTKILELPYVDEELSMVVMLPDENIDLKKVEAELTYEKFVAWTRPDVMKRTEMGVFLPRFKLEEHYDMEYLLRSFGILDAFEGGKADFSGMSAKGGLVLSKLVHKSYLEVDEEGAEEDDAAIFRVPLCGKILPTFIPDHPFLFFIRHNKTNGILFCGKFSSP